MKRLGLVAILLVLAVCLGVWLQPNPLGQFGVLEIATPTPSPVEVTSTPTPTEMPSPTPSPSATPDPLAEIEKFRPEVSFRRNAEATWDDASVSLPLFAYDALRTHKKATATLKLKNSSVLDMGQETLIIITENILRQQSWTDRAIMRNGVVDARTSNELLILSSPGLIRLRSSADGKPGQLKIVNKEGKKMDLRLTQGQAEILVKSPTATKVASRLTLTPRKLLSIKSPSAIEEFGAQPDESIWPLTQLNEVVAQNLPKKPEPLVLTVLSPAEHSEVTGGVITLKGRVTDRKAQVTVNGAVVPIDKKLGFSTQVPLARGPNLILVQATRPGEAPVFRRWEIVRTD